MMRSIASWLEARRLAAWRREDLRHIITIRLRDLNCQHDVGTLSTKVLCGHWNEHLVGWRRP